METNTMRDTAVLRNVAFVGHGATGKTTLVEHLLHKMGAIERIGTIDDGNTTTDTLADEKDRKISIDASIAHANYKGCDFNFIDAPGYPDFVGQAITALYAVETAMITVDAVAGVQVNTRRMWSEAGKLGLARVIVVTRLDAENASYDDVMQSISSAFGESVVPFVLPDGEGASFHGIVSLLDPPETIPEDCVDSVEDLRERLIERIVEVDDEALEKYLEGEKPSDESLFALSKRAIAAGTMVPVLFVAAEKDAGVQKLLDFMDHDLPSPIDGVKRTFLPTADAEEGEEVAPDPAGPFRAQVFRVVTDPFVGKITTFRIYSGSLSGDTTVLNPRTDKTEKITHFFRPMGKEQSEVKEAVAGDIIQLTKIESFSLGDTLCDPSAAGFFPPIKLPTPMMAYAVEPTKRGDEAKIGTALSKIDESDPSLTVRRDELTGELVVSGVSTLHLDIVLERLKVLGVEVQTKAPRIPYLETITTKGDAKYRHKKQSGGAGQFAEVWMRLEPQERGAGFEFANEIVGGAISASFVGSAEKGVRQVLQGGVLAGYPVVDVKAIVYDGKEHPVDSKDIAFQVAGRNAFKEAFMAAKPCLLEPVVEIEVMVPSQYIGDVTGDISGRRGRVQGTDTVGDMQTIKALVPQSEVANYSTELRSMTGGAGSYTMEISHYDVVPAKLGEQIMAAAKKEDEDKDH